MPTTTNYGWTTPADTDLVKDGASAIRTLGTAIDTTVFNNAGAAIAKTIVDAKGDIIAATAADTVSRLAVGANDTVLTADSSTATGLKWAAPAAGGMTLINTGGTALTGASVTISSIPATYNYLQLIVQKYKPSNSNENLIMRFNSDTSNNYRTYLNQSNAAWDASFIYLSSGVANTGTATGLISSQIYDYANTVTWKIAFVTGISNDGSSQSNGSYFTSLGAYNQTSAISSITLLPLSGNFATSGTAYLYGVK